MEQLHVSLSVKGLANIKQTKHVAPYKQYVQVNPAPGGLVIPLDPTGDPTYVTDKPVRHRRSC